MTNYYERNKEKCKKQSKENYQKNRKERLKQHKQWRRKNPEKHKKLMKEWYQRNRERILKEKKQKRERLKQRLRELLGDRCIFCGSKKSLVCHEIHGKPHTNSKEYIIAHYKDFVHLCYFCHKALHLLGSPKINNKKVDELLDILRKVYK